MKTRLKEIASIQTGYSFRTRLDLIGTGFVGVIQMKDLTIQNRVDCSSLLRVDIEHLNKQHLVKQGDIIFRSRGRVTTAAILLDNPGKAVVAAPLIRIRIKDNFIIPEYLCWFINQVPAQISLAGYASGTAQKMINKQVLENLEVLAPALARQKMIIELALLAEKEHQLIEKIAAKRGQYISLALLEHAKGE